MSRVYVASELSLGRQVVIKLLPPDLAAGVSTARFKREIQLAARLQHPHIVPLLSAGESDGLPYFTMPYVEGENLALTSPGALEAIRRSRSRHIRSFGCCTAHRSSSSSCTRIRASGTRAARAGQAP